MPEAIRSDTQLWADYKNAGGRLSYTDWVKAERPGAPAEKGLRFPWETTAGEGFIAPWTRQVAVPTQEGIRFRQPLTLEQRRPPPPEEPTPTPEEEAAGVDLTGFKIEVPPFPTDPPPEGFRWAFDRDMNRWVPQFTGLTAQQQSQRELQQQQLGLQRQQQLGFPSPEQPPTDAFGRTATWSERLGQWDYPPNWGQRPGDQPAPISPFQQQQFGLQEQQFGLQQQQIEQQQAQFQEQLAFQQQAQQQAAQEQEQRYRAQLAAQPINWLQYAAYTGEQPVIQPWMMPLGFQETGGQVAPQGMQIGQPIPGVQGQQTFANMPALTTPSAQLQAQWGPTAQAQFLGYRQARTGAAPAETQFRLGSGRAPTGQFGGFSRFR
ncbi:hypothetical protein LCGC14_0572230 [marine sediment metagenome]|uniref:Uncharacterized protein n=1 Tax=marine sediment metagenome TaxID=412755 RepID=A0A0F9RIZ2_9ZZZZ